MSHKSKNLNSLYQKGLLLKLDKNKAYFDDGSNEEIEDILFCTGYNYNFSFLSKKCGVEVTDNYVHPLYKQIISIENPTLGFIGVPHTVCPFPMFDIQVIISLVISALPIPELTKSKL